MVICSNLLDFNFWGTFLLILFLFFIILIITIFIRVITWLERFFMHLLLESYLLCFLELLFVKLFLSSLNSFLLSLLKLLDLGRCFLLTHWILIVFLEFRFNNWSVEVTKNNRGLKTLSVWSCCLLFWLEFSEIHWGSLLWCCIIWIRCRGSFRIATTSYWSNYFVVKEQRHILLLRS